jgi:hypothetical protein
LFLFSNPPSPPLFQRGDKENARCRFSPGCHTKRRRAVQSTYPTVVSTPFAGYHPDMRRRRASPVAVIVHFAVDQDLEVPE